MKYLLISSNMVPHKLLIFGHEIFRFLGFQVVEGNSPFGGSPGGHFHFVRKLFMTTMCQPWWFALGTQKKQNLLTPSCRPRHSLVQGRSPVALVAFPG